VEEISRLIKPVLERYGVERGILFGSYARGTQTPRSDLDMILVQSTAKPFFERYEGLLRDLYKVLPGIDIEVLIYTPEELESIRKRRFISRALAEGKVIYESR
jgi:predicted nucleotidyltransferase